MISLNKKTVSNLLVGSMISVGLFGSWMYVYDPAFAVGTIVMFSIGPFVVANFLTRAHKKIDIALFYTMLGLFALSCIAVVSYPTPDNIRYCKAFLYAFFAFAFIDYICAFNRSSIWPGCMLFLIVVGAMALPQVTYILFGVGMNPAYTGDGGEFLTADAFLTASVRSIFYNPNNFASACTLLLILFLQAKKDDFVQYVIVKISLLALIVLAGSRSCLLVAVIAIFANYWDGIKRLKKGAISKAIIFVASGSVLVAAAGSWLSKSHIFEKISTLGNIIGAMMATGTASVDDVSVRERWSAYTGFFSHFFSLGFGSFEAENYVNIYKQGTLISENPHSLALELSALYGYFGLFAFIVLMTWLYFSVRGRVNGRLGAGGLCFGVFVISCVPAAVINFSTFWILFYLIGRYPALESRVGNGERVI